MRRPVALPRATVILLLAIACGQPKDRTGVLRLQSAKVTRSSIQLTAVREPLGRDLHGQLPPGVGLQVRTIATGKTNGVIVLFVSAADISTCEDLGRQVRELQHTSAASPRSFVIATEPADTERVIAWLQRERIRYERVILTKRVVVLTSGDTIVTPAVLLVDKSGGFERGVAHPQKVSNTRSRSFAGELGFM